MSNRGDLTVDERRRPAERFKLHPLGRWDRASVIEYLCDMF